MTNSHIFEEVSEDRLSEIKKYLEEENISLNQRQNVGSTKDSFFIHKNQEKLTVSYYASKKLMIQGNPSSQFLHDLAKELTIKFGLHAQNKIAGKINVVDELNINKEGFIGFDEAGAGECFGSMFLGSAYVRKQDLQYLKKFLGKKDIKRLDKFRVYSLFNDLKDKFEYKVKSIHPHEIDDHSKNVLLDRGYRSMLESWKYDYSKQCIILDDYSTGIDINEKLDELKMNGSEIIVQQKADENYVAAMLASVVARKARLEQMDDLKEKHILIDPDDGNKVFFESGAPSNPEVENYLRSYRKIYPCSDFPFFVRKKWSNIQKLELKYPKKKLFNIFCCPLCNGFTNKLLLYVGKKGENSELYCSKCKKLIDCSDFLSMIKKPNIVVDTSVILDRAISKDLSTTGYFVGSKIILPSMLYEEIDRKKPDQKKGAHREFEYISDCTINKIIESENEDVDSYKDVANDKKFLYIIKRKNAIMLTKDNNMASFAQMNVLVIEVIQENQKNNRLS